MKRTDARGNIPDPAVFPEPESWAAELTAVEAELRRVLERFGPQSLTLLDWASVLGEEFGETCRAINHFEFEQAASSDLWAVYTELVQVAAVSVHAAAAVRESITERTAAAHIDGQLDMGEV